MQALERHECFEIEILELMNNARMLENLVFTGGTMLRLCHGLDRYSVDLDFWLIKYFDTKTFYNELHQLFKTKYRVKDKANKHFTIFFELVNQNYHRSLKIEIRKEVKPVNYSKSIAFSKFSTIQVLLNTVDLQDMMLKKTEAFLTRKAIRDCYDMEFLLKKGIPIVLSRKELISLLENINKLTSNDYKVKLGSIIPQEIRPYYNSSNFTILKAEINKLLNR